MMAAAVSRLRRKCFVIIAVLAVVCAVLPVLVVLQSRNGSTELVILMYHQIADSGDSAYTVSCKKLERDLKYISESDYTVVPFARVIDYVDGKASLPGKPMCIVFDDGYASSCDILLPLLEKYDTCAAVSVIGSMTHRELGHITLADAAAMESSGRVTVISHTYAMHMNEGDSSEKLRTNAARRSDETDAQFEAAFRADCKQMTAVMRSSLGHAPIAFAYPHGVSDPVAEKVLTEMGVRMTLITEAGKNVIERGNADSLRLLKRYNVNEAVNIGDILD